MNLIPLTCGVSLNPKIESRLNVVYATKMCALVTGGLDILIDILSNLKFL